MSDNLEPEMTPEQRERLAAAEQEALNHLHRKMRNPPSGNGMRYGVLFIVAPLAVTAVVMIVITIYQLITGTGGLAK